MDRRAAGGLPAARDRPSERHPVHRPSVAPQARHDHEEAGQGPARDGRVARQPRRTVGRQPTFSKRAASSRSGNTPWASTINGIAATLEAKREPGCIDALTLDPAVMVAEFDHVGRGKHLVAGRQQLERADVQGVGCGVVADPGRIEAAVEPHAGEEGDADPGDAEAPGQPLAQRLQHAAVRRPEADGVEQVPAPIDRAGRAQSGEEHHALDLGELPAAAIKVDHLPAPRKPSMAALNRSGNSPTNAAALSPRR